VYSRAALLAQQVHAIGSTAGVRTSKRVDQLLEEYGVCTCSLLSISPVGTGVTYIVYSGKTMFKEVVGVDKQVRSKPKMPTQAVCAEHLELRKEVITLIQLQKQVNVDSISHKVTRLYALGY
jgi:DNA methyltransferase 1-associated protein 1